jgi:hypothetical protein
MHPALAISEPFDLVSATTFSHASNNQVRFQGNYNTNSDMRVLGISVVIREAFVAQAGQSNSETICSRGKILPVFTVVSMMNPAILVYCPTLWYLDLM